MGPSLGFLTDAFFVCVELYGLFYCTIGVVLRHCFSILFEFQVIRKDCEGSGDDS